MFIVSTTVHTLPGIHGSFVQLQDEYHIASFSIILIIDDSDWSRQKRRSVQPSSLFSIQPFTTFQDEDQEWIDTDAPVVHDKYSQRFTRTASTQVKGLFHASKRLNGGQNHYQNHAPSDHDSPHLSYHADDGNATVDEFPKKEINHQLKLAKVARNSQRPSCVVPTSAHIFACR